MPSMKVGSVAAALGRQAPPQSALLVTPKHRVHRVMAAKYIAGKKNNQNERAMTWPHQKPMRSFTGAGLVCGFSTTSSTCADTTSGPIILWQGPTLSREFEAAFSTAQASTCFTVLGLGLTFLGVSPTVPPVMFSISLLLMAANVHFAYLWQTRMLRLHLRRNVVRIEQASMDRTNVALSIICDGGVSHNVILTPGRAAGAWPEAAPNSQPSLAQIFKSGIMYLDTEEGSCASMADLPRLEKLLRTDQGVLSDECHVSSLPFEMDSELAMVRKQIRFDTIASKDLRWFARHTRSPKESLSFILQMSRVVAIVAFCGGNAIFFFFEQSTADTGVRRIRAVQYTDGDGDTTRFSLENGQLIQYVNGQRKAGEHDTSGVVTGLMWSAEGSREGTEGFIGDQYGWGAEIPAGHLEPLRRLADRAGVEHNIPSVRHAHAFKYTHLYG